MEGEYQAHKAELEEGFGLKDERLLAENASLKEDMARLRASEEEANRKAAEAFGKMLEAEKAALAGKLDLQKAHGVELAKAAADAAARVSAAMEEKLRFVQYELDKLRRDSRDEARGIEEAAAVEKKRLMDELSRRDKYIEAADMKIQDMELDIMKYRQNASGTLLRQISEQDERFRVVVNEEKARREQREKAFEAEVSRTKEAYEAKIAQLGEMLAAKEKLMSDEDRMYRQKQLDLDSLHAEFNKRVNALNEELFAQKQALSDREKDLNEHRLKLEREFAVKAAETDKMKAELSRTILEYKSRK
jgi:hypothetical protein